MKKRFLAILLITTVLAFCFYKTEEKAITPFVGSWYVNYINYGEKNIVVDDRDLFSITSMMEIDKHNKVLFDINGGNYVTADIIFNKVDSTVNATINNASDDVFNGKFDVSSIKRKDKNNKKTTHQLILSSSKMEISLERLE